MLNNLAAKVPAKIPHYVAGNGPPLNANHPTVGNSRN